MKPRRLAAVLILPALLASCGHAEVEHLSSTTTPGNPIVSFPDTQDRTVTTTIWSNPTTQVSGVGGQALTITIWRGTAPTDLLTLDSHGDLGIAGSLAIRGNLTTVSTRTQKKDIAPYTGDPLALLRAVHIVTYRYKSEPEATAPHIGFIAEDTPSQLSGPEHNRFNVTNSVAVSIAAEQHLDRSVRNLEAQVRDLQAQVRVLQSERR